MDSESEDMMTRREREPAKGTDRLGQKAKDKRVGNDILDQQTPHGNPANSIVLKIDNMAIWNGVTACVLSGKSLSSQRRRNL